MVIKKGFYWKNVPVKTFRGIGCLLRLFFKHFEPSIAKNVMLKVFFPLFIFLCDLVKEILQSEWDHHNCSSYVFVIGTFNSKTLCNQTNM